VTAASGSAGTDVLRHCDLNDLSRIVVVTTSLQSVNETSRILGLRANYAPVTRCRLKEITGLKIRNTLKFLPILIDNTIMMR